MSDKRNRILYLSKIFYQLTDENNCLSMEQLIDELNKYGCTASRKAIYEDISALKQFGFDIRYERSKLKSGYHLVSRKFELPEIKLLIDAVNSSQFLSEKKTRTLTDKLYSLCSITEKNEMKHQIGLINIAKTFNEKIYLNIDMIQSALNSHKKIEFDLFDHDIHREKSYRNGKRICTPYYLVWNDGRYYVVAYYEKYPDQLTNFRIDRMDNIRLLDDTGEPINNKFDINKYISETFSMFSGKTESVILEFENSNSMLNIVFDRFGKHIIVIPQDESSFRVKLDIKPEKTFWGWLFGLGDKVKIISPEHLIEKYTEQLSYISEKYKK